MLFEVVRTSIWDKQKPYEKCIQIKLKRVEKYYISVEEFIKRYSDKGDKWFNRGKNHRIKNGCILRDFEDVQSWGIKINTLEELMKFKKEVDTELVITKSIIDEETPCIEIYDDYRE